MSGKAGSEAFDNAILIDLPKEQAKALLAMAIAAFQRGDCTEAATLCRQILSAEPDEFDALHLLGVLELDGPSVDDAERVLQRAVKVRPNSAEAHSNLGLACAKLKKFEEARKNQEMAIALDPNFSIAFTNLGNVLLQLQLPELAVEAHDRAIRIRPDYVDAYSNRGTALLVSGRPAEADASFDRALSLQPRHLAALVGKAIANIDVGQYDAAQQAFDTVFAVNPHVPEALLYRGRMKMALGKFDEAEADFDAALVIAPRWELAWASKAHNNLLATKIASAIDACHKLLEINPKSEAAISSLGDCHLAQGEVATALQFYDRAFKRNPDSQEVMLKKIFAMDFLEDADFAVHQAARREWWENIGAKLPRREIWPRSLDPGKRIRVGYVSSDFYEHSAALAFVPILRHHDHHQFEIIAYSSAPRRDSRTSEIKSLVDVWVDAFSFSDDQLADRIQHDLVDILVDLSGHTGGNRLSVFARKPAPVQVSACGSVTGTGLLTMDYLLADPVFVPKAVRHLFAEEIYDLPCGITTAASVDMQPTELPMSRNGFVTFGVFNRLQKISDRALNVWSTILRKIATSRIIVKNASLSDPVLRDLLIGRFVQQGIMADRITCIGSTPHAQHLGELAKVDISLDPFPQNGGVSTWESLRMGVPVICKLGRSACSRAGGAIVKAVGLDDWVAEDDDGYIAIARKFADLPAELSGLRAGLPARVASSAAGNNEIYARCVETGYRQFWRRYCDGQL